MCRCLLSRGNFSFWKFVGARTVFSIGRQWDWEEQDGQDELEEQEEQSLNPLALLLTCTLWRFAVLRGAYEMPARQFTKGKRQFQKNNRKTKQPKQKTIFTCGSSLSVFHFSVFFCFRNSFWAPCNTRVSSLAAYTSPQNRISFGFKRLKLKIRLKDFFFL